MYCNNCGQEGHVFKTCKHPVTSCGILLVQNAVEPYSLPCDSRFATILMVKRKDSMSYMEFIRGKYNITDIEYIQKLIMNMTVSEQKNIISEEFDTLWTKLWGPGRDTHSLEYENSKINYNCIDRKKIVEDCPSKFTEPEWGFPKGRRMRGESDLDCALREFNEETNISTECLQVFPDVVFTEIFRGTNNIQYKHIYFLALLKTPGCVNLSQRLTSTQRREVSAVDWKSFKQCRTIIRPHYVERKKIIDQLEKTIETLHET